MLMPIALMLLHRGVMAPSLCWGDVDRKETEPRLFDPFKPNVAIQASVLVPFGIYFHMQIEMDLHAHELG